MRGLMQDWPLTVDRVLDHAARVHGTSEVVSRHVDGTIHRTTYAAIHERARQVSAALLALGVQPGQRVATLCWNSERHMECWYGAMGMGAVLHTLNPRLHADQLAWIANHAEDCVLILDLSFLPLIESLRDRLPVRHYVLLAGREDMPANTLDALCYEDWIGEQTPLAQWAELDEHAACSLCYTSGTTGNPKGVLYSHRSNVLHAMMVMGKDALGVGASDVVMPVVPMFHANAWGLPFAAPGAGAALVMPGGQLDGASVHELLDRERVTVTAAVPTVWLGLLEHLRRHDLKLPWLKRVIIGGAALPEAILHAFEDDYGVEVVQGWGMTETSPLGTVSVLPRQLADAPAAARTAAKLRQGRPPFGVELDIVDDAGHPLPHDGEAAGNLIVRGFAVASAYFGQEDGQALDTRGFFATGDVATIDRYGSMKITDRAKDVIKSGGEWISSIEIEGLALSFPGIANAAAIGVPHPKWDERPVLVIEPTPGADPDHEALRDHLAAGIASWWLPDSILRIERIPLGATGKTDKAALRRWHATGNVSA